MYEQLGVNAKVVQGSTFKVYVQPSIHCLYLIYVPKILPKNYVTVEIYLNRSRCGAGAVHFTEIGQIFQSRYIF